MDPIDESCILTDTLAQLEAERREVERLTLWLLGIMQEYGEMSNLEPMDAHQHNVWHGIVRIVGGDGSSEMYFTETEDDALEWNDSPFGSVEWVVKPKELQ